mmetsp:Transcript_4590/g.14642  ORF Transcript_4590/g.14642 Transcript_4590/m.14642 type:complete len:339 (-) Transcript_4590:61-1077(-)
MADAAATTTAAPPAVTTVAALPSIVFASLAGSAVLVELTVPQIVRLSLPTKTPLPNTPLAARIAMQPRLLGPQTALTTLQFGLTREVRDLLDRALGPNKLHLSAAYGIASGPCRAAAYNLLIAGTYAYHGRSAQGGTDSLPERARTFWLTKVKPGLLWSVLRDSGSVGGGIVLAPTVTPRDAPPPLKFACGVGAGALCGLDVRVAGPKGADFDIEPGVLEECAELTKAPGAGTVTVCDTAADAVAGADVVYADSWMSYGTVGAERDARLNALMPFQVDSALMKHAAPDAIFMNCLPAMRGEEQTADVIDGPQSVVFDQAENRLHAQKALLVKLLVDGL